MVVGAVRILETKDKDVGKDETVNINHLDFCFRCSPFKPRLGILNP